MRPIAAPGHGGVDYETRVDFARLREYRLARARAALESSDMQASRLRSQAVTPHGGEIQAVDRCEVVIDFSELSRA